MSIRLDEWNAVKSIVGPGNLASVRVAETENFEEELNRSYESDFIGFKGHIKRFITLSLNQHYEELARRNRKGISEFLSEFEERVSDENIFSRETLDMVLSGTLQNDSITSQISRKVPFKLGRLTEYGSNLRSHLMDIITTLKVVPLDDMFEDYVKLRGDSLVVGASYEQEKASTIDQRTRNSVLEELVTRGGGQVTREDSKVYISSNVSEPLEISFVYDASTGQLDVNLTGELDLEGAKRYFGDLEVVRPISTYAGRELDLRVGSRYGDFDLEEAKLAVQREIMEYESDEQPVEIKDYNLEEKDATLLFDELEPLYVELNEVRNKINSAESKFVLRSTPKFGVLLRERDTTPSDYEAEVGMTFNGSTVKVTGAYTLMDTNKVAALNHLFS